MTTSIRFSDRTYYSIRGDARPLFEVSWVDADGVGRIEGFTSEARARDFQSRLAGARSKRPAPVGSAREAASVDAISDFIARARPENRETLRQIWGRAT